MDDEYPFLSNAYRRGGRPRGRVESSSEPGTCSAESVFLRKQTDNKSRAFSLSLGSSNFSWTHLVLL